MLCNHVYAYNICTIATYNHSGYNNMVLSFAYKLIYSNFCGGRITPSWHAVIFSPDYMIWDENLVQFLSNAYTSFYNLLCFSLLSFLPLRQKFPSFPDDRTSTPDWPARESLLDPPTDAQATPTAPAQGDQGSIQTQSAVKLLSPSSGSLERLVTVMSRDNKNRIRI